MVPDVDWQAARAAMQAASTPREQRPLRWARALSPVLLVGLDDSLSMVVQIVPETATRADISDGDAIKAAVDEAREIRAQLEAAQPTARRDAKAGS